MYLQEILEVIIGLVFIWLLLSTATMQVVEWIANALKWRANDLEKNIRRMLNDSDLTARFYDHPLIRTLSEEKGGREARPSYIPANKFSTVLLSIIENAETESSLLMQELYTFAPQLKHVKPAERRTQARADFQRLVELARLSMSAEGGQAMGNLMLTTLQKEMIDLSARYPELKTDPKAALEKVADRKAQIDALMGTAPESQSSGGDFGKVLKGMLALRVTNPGLRLTLSSLFIGIEEASAAGGDCLQLLRANIETWFNDSMDRLSGRYKRKAQLAAFSIGIVIAAAANVDTINIANQLWREPILRQAITASADQALQQTGQAAAPALNVLITSLQNQYLNVTLPIGWSFVKADTLAGQTCSIISSPGSTFGIALNGGCLRPVDTPLSADGWIWRVSKLAGLLITGVATSQGSAFWFDILVKIVNVRGTGLKPV